MHLVRQASCLLDETGALPVLVANQRPDEPEIGAGHSYKADVAGTQSAVGTIYNVDMSGIKDPVRRNKYQREFMRRYRAAGSPAWLRADKRVKERRAFKNAVMAIFKEHYGCKDCGISDSTVLEFDHREPLLKSKDVERLSQSTWARLCDEISKCDVRCANCHRRRTINEKHSVIRRGRTPGGAVNAAS